MKSTGTTNVGPKSVQSAAAVSFLSPVPDDVVVAINNHPRSLRSKSEIPNPKRLHRMRAKQIPMFKISNISSENDKTLLETEIDVLKGVKNINIANQSGESWVEFDSRIISQEEIFSRIEELKFQIKKEELASQPIAREHTYYVSGMHCASCEVLIEKKLAALKEIKSVEASVNHGWVLVVFQGNRPSSHKLNEIFRQENYFFSDQPIKNTEKGGNDFFTIAGAALLIIVGFFWLKNSGLAGLINVNSTSSLPVFFLLGLLAGVSSCAALVGGLILSMSKQWLTMYSEKTSTFEKLEPHLMFNIGRIASYAILGGVIGAIGSKFQISLTFNFAVFWETNSMFSSLAIIWAAPSSLIRPESSLILFLIRASSSFAVILLLSRIFSFNSFNGILNIHHTQARKQKIFFIRIYSLENIETKLKKMYREN